ncbi:hypothetical protein [Kitasatospora sp. HPMI-4]
MLATPSGTLACPEDDHRRRAAGLARAAAPALIDLAASGWGR